MTAREKFKIGDRVRLTRSLTRGSQRHSSATTGTVTGFSNWNLTQDRVWVLRDGCRRTAVYRDWEWEVDTSAPPPDLDRVARKLVTALHLYSGYTVGSRGPSGCIMDALDEVAPGIAREIRDGEEPADIFQRRWPEP